MRYTLYDTIAGDAVSEFVTPALADRLVGRLDPLRLYTLVVFHDDLVPAALVDDVLAQIGATPTGVIVAAGRFEPAARARLEAVSPPVLVVDPAGPTA